MTKPEFDNVIIFIEGGSRRKLDADQKRAYWRVLSHYPFRAVMIRAEEFFDSDRGLRGMPEIADLRTSHHEVAGGTRTRFVKCDTCGAGLAVETIIEVDSTTGEGKHRSDLTILEAHYTQHAREWMTKRHGADEATWPTMMDSLRRIVAGAKMTETEEKARRDELRIQKAKIEEAAEDVSGARGATLP